MPRWINGFVPLVKFTHYDSMLTTLFVPSVCLVYQVKSLLKSEVGSCRIYFAALSRSTLCHARCIHILRGSSFGSLRPASFAFRKGDSMSLYPVPVCAPRSGHLYSSLIPRGSYLPSSRLLSHIFS